MTWIKPRKTRDAKGSDSAGGKARGLTTGLSSQKLEKCLTIDEILEIAAEREAANLLNDNQLKLTEGKTENDGGAQ
jgi:hypothetical protein